MKLEEMEFLTNLNASLKKKTENESMVRTRPIVRSVEPEHIKAYMLSIAVHYCYSCSVDKNITLMLCKEAILNLNIDLPLNQDKAYDYLTVQSVALKAVQQVVERWMTSPPPCLTNEMTPTNGNDEGVEKVEEPKIEYCTVTNKRHKQEDRYFAVSDLRSYSVFNNTEKAESPVDSGSKPVLAVGVFDGHNGPEAAEHANNLSPLYLAGYLQSGSSVFTAMGETFYRLNESINHGRKKFRWHSGATSTFCVIKDDVVHTGWLGDSQAWIVLREAGCVPLTDALHRPCFGSEHISVLNNGGMVSDVPGDERVSGVLGVSRGLGDDLAIQGVSALPSTTVYPLRGSELCLIVASDGLWDAEDCDGEEVANFTRQWCAENKAPGAITPPSRSLSKCLVDRAIEAGSLDNTTVVVVWFQSAVCPAEKSTTTPVSVADSRAVRYPEGRRRSAEVQELVQLRHCPQQLRQFLHSRAQGEAGETGESEGERLRRGRDRPGSVPMEIVPLRFSSPTRLVEPTD